MENKRLGRPSKGKTESGEAVRVRDFASINARLPIELERKVRALAYLSGMTTAELFRKIVEDYLSLLPPELLRKVTDRAKEAGSQTTWKLSDLK